MFIREYLRLMLRRPLLSLLVASAVFAAVLGAALTAKPTYVSTNSSLFAFTAGNSATDLNQAATYLQREMTSYVRVATSPRVLQPVIDRLGLQETPGELAESIAAANPTMTVILDIAVTREDPKQAADIANAVAESVATVVADIAPIQQEGGVTRQTLTVTPLNVAQPAAAPQNMSPLVSAIIGVVLGVIAAFVVALLVSGIDSRVRNVEDLRRMRGPRVLAALPTVKSSDTKRVHELTKRLERTAGLLVGAKRGDSGTLVLVTTPDADPDLTQATHALAAATSQVGGRAAILDTAAVSAMQVVALAQNTPADGATIAVQVLDREGETTSLIRPADLRRLADEFDVVLIQVPAFTVSADAQLLADVIDVAVVLVSMGTDKERVTAVQAGLRSLASDNVVIVANRVRSHDL
ncbi:MAG: hypothetical protein Q4G51_07025 [Dermatophilus congolensis]|nr:hypothetical protein [Dermatophilus congolensis]